jgi:hypothetical protein
LYKAGCVRITDELLRLHFNLQSANQDRALTDLCRGHALRAWPRSLSRSHLGGTTGRIHGAIVSDLAAADRILDPGPDLRQPTIAGDG